MGVTGWFERAYTPAPGQVWAEDGEQLAGRTVQVVTMDDRHAICAILTKGGEPYVRDATVTVRVPIDQMRSSCGWRMTGWEHAGPPVEGHSAGHSLVWDPTGHSAARRWTCCLDRCGATLIDYHGSVYGSAVDRPCAVGKPADDRPYRADLVEGEPPADGDLAFHVFGRLGRMDQYSIPVVELDDQLRDEFLGNPRVIRVEVWTKADEGEKFTARYLRT